MLWEFIYTQRDIIRAIKMYKYVCIPLCSPNQYLWTQLTILFVILSVAILSQFIIQCIHQHIMWINSILFAFVIDFFLFFFLPRFFDTIFLCHQQKGTILKKTTTNCVRLDFCCREKHVWVLALMSFIFHKASQYLLNLLNAARNLANFLFF